MSFEINESVIVATDQKYYLAKIVSFEKPRKRGQKIPKYQIHYMGWGDSYDQWVYATSILKDNEVNRALMKYRNNGETFGNFSLSIWEEINNTYAEDKRAELPFQLHQILIKDWFLVENCKKLVPLPRTPNIKSILRLYYDDMKRQDGVELANVEALTEGILYYFNIAADSTVLYVSELDQYHSIQSQHMVNMCDVYGGEHLLRFLSQIPALYSTTDFTPKELNVIQSTIDSLLKFLVDHCEVFLNPNQYIDCDANK